MPALVTTPLWRRMSRYTMGSVICFGVSEVVFVLLFGPHLLGARGASITASIAGIIPGYFLNRHWAWGRRGRSNFWREVIPYWATALVSTVVAAVVIGVVNDAFGEYSRDVRTVINAVAYMATYGVLFVAKYILFNRLFASRDEQLRKAEPPRDSATTEGDAAAAGRVDVHEVTTGLEAGRGVRAHTFE